MVAPWWNDVNHVMVVVVAGVATMDYLLGGSGGAIDASGGGAVDNGCGTTALTTMVMATIWKVILGCLGW